MTDDKPTRRDLLKPVQLLGLAFAAAVFTGLVTLVVMGFFQHRVGTDPMRALVVAGVAAGVAFIAVLLIVSLLLLAVDPAQIRKPVDHPVLYDTDPGRTAAQDGAATSGDVAGAGDPEAGSATGDKPGA